MRSNVEWKEWGNVDPLFGVASIDGRSRGGPDPWTEEEFYGWGATNWAEYLRHWECYGLNTNSCVEIGCGAGRMTKQLARYFCFVHAVDVSADMIAIARKNVCSDNVRFYLSGGSDLPIADSSAMAAFSCEVFQHFNSPIAARDYLRELYRVLDRAGTLMIGLPVYRWPKPLTRYRLVYRLTRVCDVLKAEVRRFLIAIGCGSPFMYLIEYEAPWLARTLTEIGFDEIEVRFFYNTAIPLKRFGSWIFARKP